MIGNMPGGLNRMLEGSMGMQANRMLDALGLPDNIGDMLGAQIDAASGDMAGFARNMMDLNSGMSSGQLDGLFGRGLIGSHFAQPPHIGMPKGRKLWGQTFHTPFGTHDVSRQRLGGRGRRGRRIGRAMERAIKRNPAFKAHLEKVLGGRIQLDGRNDGKVTVHRFKPNFSGAPFGAAIAGNPMMSGLYGSLARLEGNIQNLAQSMTKGGATAGSGNIGAQGLTGSTPDAALLKDPDMAKLADGMGMKPPLSFEDMLFMMMMKYARKKEKEILGKMNELSGKGDTKGAEGTTGATGTAGATGTQGTEQRQPTAAETANHNKQVDQAIAAGTISKEQGTQAKADGPFGDPSKTSDTLKQMQMQKLMEDLKKMYEMLSNVMKSMHSMQMAAVRNLR